MTAIDASPDPTAAVSVAEPHSSAFARILFAINALLAWIALAMSTFIDGTDLYHYTGGTPGLFGDNTSAFGRLLDEYSYFTVVSNLLVAVILTILVFKPSGHGNVFKVLRLDTLLMITVTGIVYWVLLAPTSNPQELNRITDLLFHTLVPIFTVVVWLVVGPRDWIRWWMIFAALIVPLLWAVYTLVRGSIINAYPYDFINVSKYGLGPVLTTIGDILVFGVIVGFIYWAVDLLLSRKARQARLSAETS
jgi:hypothetical protein